MSFGRIVQNFGFLTAGKTLGDLFTFLFFVVLSRTFGKEGIGAYSFGMALTGFFATLAEFGLYDLSVKHLSRRWDSIGELYGRILALRLLLCTGATAILAIALPLLPFPSEIKLIALLLGAYQIVYTLVDGFAAVFVAREDMQRAGLLEFSLRAVTALAGIAIVAGGGSLLASITALPVVAGLHLFLAGWWTSRKYGKPRLPSFRRIPFETLREAIPYALSGMLAQLSSRVDVVLLGFFLGAAAAGLYNASYRVIFLLLFLPGFASLAVFPVASRLYVEGRDELKTLYERSLRYLVLAAVPATLGLWLISPQLIALIYGEGFAESAVVLRLLASLVLLVGLASLVGTFLTSCDRQSQRTSCQWIAAAANVVGNLILIPIWGMHGAAVSTVASEALLVVLLLARLRDVFGWPRIGSRLAASVLGSAVFCIPFGLMDSPSLFIVVPAAAGLYVATLSMFRQIRQDELTLFRKPTER